MILLEAVLLGVIQGLTEFLPVSSSAHLILAKAFFGWDADRFGLSFDVACHLGTLLAVLAYFRQDLVRMIAAAPRVLSRSQDAPARLAWLIAVGTIPVVIVGLLLRNLEDALRTPAVVGVTLALGGLLLLWAERVARRTRQRGGSRRAVKRLRSAARSRRRSCPASRAPVRRSRWPCSWVCAATRRRASRSCSAFPPLPRPPRTKG